VGCLVFTNETPDTSHNHTVYGERYQNFTPKRVILDVFTLLCMRATWPLRDLPFAFILKTMTHAQPNRPHPRPGPTTGGPIAAPVVTRFAPSPTGLLHIGHAYAALFAYQAANPGQNDPAPHTEPGRFLLRIEDIDTGRCRGEFEDAIYEDLAWLGLDWHHPVRRQSDHMADYQAALDRLAAQNLLYPCFCTRAEITAEIKAANSAPHLLSGPDGPLYPGTCRHLSPAQRQARQAAGHPFALRLDMARATAQAGPLYWTDQKRGTITATPKQFGDVILARKDTPTSYHLSVTLDDHLQGVTLVTRGQDLFAATHVHRLLQHLLNLTPPQYLHHKLLSAPDGRRLAKRNTSRTLCSLRQDGIRQDQLRRTLGL